MYAASAPIETPARFGNWGLRFWVESWSGGVNLHRCIHIVKYSISPLAYMNRYLVLLLYKTLT